MSLEHLIKTTKLTDTSNIAQGVLMNGGSLVTIDFLDSIARDIVSNAHIFRKIGYSNVIGSSLVDLWGIGTAATYVFPTAGIQMQIKAGGSASDAGVAAYTGTATGGSATTLVDISKNFTTLPVVAGDFVVVQNGNTIDFGVVTGVAATTLTLSGGFSNGTNPTGLAYSVIDKSAGGTGVQVAALHYLDTNYQEKETYMVTNGASAVNTTPTDILRVQSFHSLVVGHDYASSGAAATINLVDTATGLVTYAIISTGFDRAQQAIWTVPALDTSGNTISAAYINSWQASGAKATGTPVCTLRLRTTSHNGKLLPGVFQTEDICTVVNNDIEIPFRSSIKLAPKTDIKISVISDAAGTTFSGGFSGWYQ